MGSMRLRCVVAWCNVLWSGAVCCSVLQCVAVCCIVLHCVVVRDNTYGVDALELCCSVSQCVAVCCIVLHCDEVCCTVMKYVAVCCSVLQCVAVCCSVLHCVTMCCTILDYVMIPTRPMHPMRYTNEPVMSHTRVSHVSHTCVGEKLTIYIYIHIYIHKSRALCQRDLWGGYD